jgi:hypothetical protein
MIWGPTPRQDSLVGVLSKTYSEEVMNPHVHLRILVGQLFS